MSYCATSPSHHAPSILWSRRQCWWGACTGMGVGYDRCSGGACATPECRAISRSAGVCPRTWVEALVNKLMDAPDRSRKMTSWSSTEAGRDGGKLIADGRNMPQQSKGSKFDSLVCSSIK